VALALHVSGECLLKTGTGSVGALESLGVSVAGVDINITDHTDPVYTDTNGPRVPFDEQQFLEDATITCKLVFYDETVLSHIRSRIAILASNADGTIGAAGVLWGAGGNYFRLLCLSPVDATPYNFPKARLKDAMRVKKGTVRSEWDLTFYSIPYTGSAGSTLGNTLWNTTTTAILFALFGWQMFERLLGT
jgi:hypothetical protein